MTSQYARMPKMAVVSLATPPCRKKLSSPARSVSTLKLMARNALVTTSRTTLAMSQPPMITTMAINSRGMKAPT